MSTNDELKINIENRNLIPENILIASFIAGISSFGILNQAVVSVAARQTGKDLADYASIVDTIDIDAKVDTIDKCKNSIKILQSLLHISDDIKCKKDSDIITISIKASKCRYCPKGVGHAELSGTLCPFPSIIEMFINTLYNSDVIKVLKERGVPLLVKEDDWCDFKYTILDK